MAPEDLLFPPAVHALGRLVPTAQVKVEVADDHCVGHLAEDAGDQTTESRGRVGCIGEADQGGLLTMPNRGLRGHLDRHLAAVGPLEVDETAAVLLARPGHGHALEDDLLRAGCHQLDDGSAHEVGLVDVSEQRDGRSVGVDDTAVGLDEGAWYELGSSIVCFCALVGGGGTVARQVQPVACTPDGSQYLGTLGVVLDLGPEATDVLGDGGGLLPLGGGLPHRLEQLAPGEDVAGSRRQEGEQVELLGRQVQYPVIGSNLAGPQIDRQRTDLQTCVLVRIARASHGQDADGQLAKEDRLHHVVVGAPLQRPHAVCLGGRRAHDNDVGP